MARVEGSPEGTRGISLFLVPKYWVNDDGSLGERNDITCTGIEEKMGIHGSATCSLALGSKGKCRGLLLGEVDKGMRAMFKMMNEERLVVGLQALTCASSSYINAVNYARGRVQGPNLLKMLDKDPPSVPIIEHPDVRRMLITMKAYVEGMRSLIYYIGHCLDKIAVVKSEDEKSKYQGLVDFLLPIAKGYVSDRACEITSLGVQVYGGYGYIKEYPQEQLMRDCRITPIYEGSNGIQAMDLLGRKLGMSNGKRKPAVDLLNEIVGVTHSAKKINEIKGLAEKVEKTVNALADTAFKYGAKVLTDTMPVFAHAATFMEVVGDCVMAWMLLERAQAAAKRLKKAKKKDKAFYKGQIFSARFFIENVLPLTKAKMEVVEKIDSSAIDIDDASFGGK